MSSRSPDADANTDAATGSEREGAPGIPRWVKLLALAGLVAIALVAIVMLVAGGQHGPGMHMP